MILEKNCHPLFFPFFFFVFCTKVQCKSFGKGKVSPIKSLVAFRFVTLGDFCFVLVLNSVCQPEFTRQLPGFVGLGPSSCPCADKRDLMTLTNCAIFPPCLSPVPCGIIELWSLTFWYGGYIQEVPATGPSCT